jgi:hypothetical protein
MRNRPYYALAIVIITLIGLPTRMDILPLPQPILKYGGGILWAALIYLILAAIFAKARTRHLWLAGLVIVLGIEFSQLYKTEELTAFRATLLGRLTIGGGFLWGDVMSYIIGVTGAALMERYLLSMGKQNDEMPNSSLSAPNNE